MAHGLTIRQNGFVEMAYANATPWHTLGQSVSVGASIEEWQEASGTNYVYLRAPVQFQAAIAPIVVDGKVVTMKLLDFPENHVIFRSDTNARMSIVSKDYKIVQPGQILEFFRNLVSDAGFQIETVGTLQGGKKIWALAKTNFDADILSGDNVKAYLLLVTSCDGSLATTGMFTSVRVVCQNTLGMALSGKSEGVVKIRHSTVFDPNAMKDKMGLMGENAFGSYVQSMKALTKINMNVDKADTFLQTLLKTSAAHGDVTKTTGYKKLMGLFQGGAMGSDIDGVQGSAWGMLNAVTEYVDYAIPARTIGNRFHSGQFGAGASMKQKALELLTA